MEPGELAMKNPLWTAGYVLLITAGIAACAKKQDEAKPAEAAASAVAPIAASTGVKPFTIGLFQAAALSDGELTVANDNKTLAINKKKADVDAVLTANNLPTDQIHLSVQPLVVKTP